MNRQRLEHLAREWRRFAAVRTLRWVYVAVGLAGVVWMALPPGGRLALEILTPMVVAAVCGWWTGRTRPDVGLVARHLDRTYPALEESSGLWLRPAAGLTTLERMQLARLNWAAEALKATLPPHARLGQPPPYGGEVVRFALGTSLGLLVLGFAVAFRHGHTPGQPTTATVPRTPTVVPAPSIPPVWPSVREATLTITPPAYTGHASRQVAGLSATVEEGSTVGWTLVLDRPVRDLRLVPGPATAQLSLSDAHDPLRWRGRGQIMETWLYSLGGTLPDGTAWNPPDVYSLTVVRDRPPTVRIVQPAQTRTVVVPPPPPSPLLPGALNAVLMRSATCTVEVEASDDYGLADAHLVATVAKGSGEAVKFREQAMAFDQGTVPGQNGAGQGVARKPIPSREGSDGRPGSGSEGQPNPGTNAATRRLTKTLDLVGLGLEPGDELYFYVEASDNRQPNANHTRSETRFVTLLGPAQTKTDAGRGVSGINLVPQYFRSERQLIIDTEALVAARATLSDAEFRRRANDLGADQALLRLRYGQFLGEDQETGPMTDHVEANLDPLQAGPPAHEAGPHAAASIALRFRQEHAAQAEAGGSDESRDASLRPAPTTPLSAAQIRQPYVDTHDATDKATFFDPASKGTMRDALSAMWAAEGELRVAQPAEALPHEHRALDILKAVQESDRAYVQHVGFEAAPIQVAQRRGQGELTGVPARAVDRAEPAPDDPKLTGVRAALAALTIGGSGVGMTEALRQVEPTLLAAATREPARFLPGLQALRQIVADGGNTATSADALAAAQRGLLGLLPAAPVLPERAAATEAPLRENYARALANEESKPSTEGPKRSSYPAKENMLPVSQAP